MHQLLGLANLVAAILDRRVLAARPALLADRYRERFSLGLLTAAGSLGLLLPYALPLLVYAMVTVPFKAALGLGLALVLNNHMKFSTPIRAAVMMTVS